MPLSQNVSGTLKKITKLTENVSGTLKPLTSLKQNVSGTLKEVFSYIEWIPSALYCFQIFHLNVGGAVGNPSQSGNYTQHIAAKGENITLSLASQSVSTGYMVLNSRSVNTVADSNRGNFHPKEDCSMTVTITYSGSNTNGGACDAYVMIDGTKKGAGTYAVTPSNSISLGMSQSCSVSPSGASYTSASCKGVTMTIAFS